MVNHLPADLPHTSEIAVDWRVLGFTSLISLVTGILVGLDPLFQSRRIGSSSETLKQSGRGIAGGQSVLRNGLIVGQVAIALVRLVGAGLMSKTSVRRCWCHRDSRRNGS
jgi:putative ABC transport system permease protein